jgi:alanine racemase
MAVRGHGKQIPDFHLKMDTGMRRQGFYLEDVPKVIALIKKSPQVKNSLKGIFTHFASAKDINYPTFTDGQSKNFKDAADLFAAAGFTDLIKHAAATGGALIGEKHHFDAIRVGIGLYGHWPSNELEAQLGGSGAGGRSLRLYPVLSWRAVVGEVKCAKKGDYIGYNMTERLSRDATIAIIPIGYWHGFPWALSGSGEVLIRGRRVRVLGRVAMDMIAVGLPEGGRGSRGVAIKPGDIATLIGSDGDEMITAEEQAARSHGATMNYELLTRLNPLMERVIIR